MEFENEMNNFNLKAERFAAFDYKEFGIYGCGMSHLQVLEQAKANKYKNVLIFEDDFMFLVSKKEFEENIEKLFETYAHFDVCMLSYGIQESEEIIGESFIRKVKKAETASAYIIQEHYYDKLIDLYKMAMPLLLQTRAHWIYANDKIWNELQKCDNWVYFEKRIGKQRPSYSDNSNCFRNLDV